MSEPARLTIHKDRFFDSDSGIRKVARALHEETRTLPIISPHGHVDARVLADNPAFPEPTALILLPDHYLLRMLHSQGIGPERLGVPTHDGIAFETDPKRAWQRFGEQYHLFRGTPSAIWLDYELHELFGVRVKLDGTTAQHIYGEIAEKLASLEFRPRALFERFNIEVLATTDAATDPLASHAAIRASGWRGRVIPTFRPDALFQIASHGWNAQLSDFASVVDASIANYASFIQALERRRADFRGMGGTATDHAVEEPYAERLPDEEADRLFQRALELRATAADQHRFEAHMLMEMARMSSEDGLVMQLHAGSLRNHDLALFARFGPNIGGDIPVASEFTRNLRHLLNAYGHDPRMRLILFTLDESTYARELAPLAGLYGAVRLGPPWWFHDSIEGMTRFRERTTETAGIYNTAGFNDDTRSFTSIPARHDLSRRVDANWLARLVSRHVIDMADARDMAHALAYGLAKDAYRLSVVS
ncbi:MAG: glucuronate isomerase [Gemmatimonadaceae bacterium]